MLTPVPPWLVDRESWIGVAIGVLLLAGVAAAVATDGAPARPGADDIRRCAERAAERVGPTPLQVSVESDGEGWVATSTGGASVLRLTYDADGNVVDVLTADAGGTSALTPGTRATLLSADC